MNDRSSLFGADGARMQWSGTTVGGPSYVRASQCHTHRYTDAVLSHELQQIKARLHALEESCEHLRDVAYVATVIAAVALVAMLAMRFLL